MKKQLLLFLLLITSIFVEAQIGIGVGYLNHDPSNNWLTTTSNTNQELPGSGFATSIDYRLKLKSIRIEFYPYLGFSRQQQDLHFNTEPINAEVTGFHLGLNSRIYPLDLEGDCDCPTWRKEGPTLEKGLFLQLGAGLSLYRFTLDLSETSFLDNDAAPFFGGGLGFDIGISDLLTITPQAMIHYYPKVTWESLESDMILGIPDEIKAETSLLQYQLGIHLGFHLRN